jgi:sugar lactone lactonase YvrE
MTSEMVLAAADIVGESLIWDDRRNRLVWVDIIGRRIHALDPATGAHRLWNTPGRVTSIGLRADGGAILGFERHIALWDWENTFLPVYEVEPDVPGNRLNEGVVGPDGAFWVGTMQNNIADDDSARPITAATGRIYRYLPDGALLPVTDDHFGITNTFVWPDAECFITADTTRNAIFRYRFNPNTGALSERRVLLDGFARGLPDGSCLDAEGMIWTARVAGGSCLTRMTPQGDVIGTFELDCSWPTSCAFGGLALDTLYVTSARFTLSAEHLAAHPGEGALFAIKPGVSGVASRRFGATRPTY